MLYDKKEYIHTDAGNIISRKAVICGSTNILLGGNTIILPRAVLRGDLRRAGTGSGGVLSIGKYATIGEGCVIRPPYKVYKGVFSYYPMKIGEYVEIGSDTIIEAAQIGVGVKIGSNCVIGRFTVIKDFAEILDNTILGPGTVVPSLTVYGGSPAKIVDELTASFPELSEASARVFYKSFQPIS